MKIGLLSDTHGYLDPKVFEYFKDVDEIWHAGDIGDIKVIEELEKFKKVRAVFGNIDSASVYNRFPEDWMFTCEGVEVWITHIGVHIKFTLHTIDNDLEVKLSHARDNRLAGFFVRMHTERWILTCQLT